MASFRPWSRRRSSVVFCQRPLDDRSQLLIGIGALSCTVCRSARATCCAAPGHLFRAHSAEGLRSRAKRRRSGELSPFRKADRPPSCGCRALGAVHRAEGRSVAALATVAFSRLGPIHRTVRGPEAGRRSKHAWSDHAGKRAVLGPWPSGRQSVPGRDRSSVAFSQSSLTGSVFQPTWVVSAIRRVRLQRFCAPERIERIECLEAVMVAGACPARRVRRDPCGFPLRATGRRIRTP